jgi:hypothetical protein
LEVDFTFMKTTAVIKGPESLTQSPIEFSCTPSQIKLGTGAAGILNVVSKLKNSYQLATLGKESKGKIEKYNHLLIGRVKDT